jgi:V/A-type H+-transporting ATPase subunit I
MLRPAAMKRVLIVIPASDAERVVEAVGALGVLHLLDLSQREEWTGTTSSRELEERRRACQERLRRIEAHTRFFAPPPQPEAPVEEPPAWETVDGELRLWTGQMEEMRQVRSELGAQLGELERSLHACSSLAPGGLEPQRLHEVRRLHPAFGWIEERHVERLEESLARLPHRIVTVDSHGSQRLVLAFCLAHDRAALERALDASGFVPVSLPPRVAGPAPEAARALETLREESRAKLAALEERFERTRSALGPALARARAAIERELIVSEARALMSRSESVTFIAGWIPERQLDELQGTVRRATGGRCYVRADSPQSIDPVRVGAEPVPILFRNPALVRPFERLVASYGAPRWREIDPTPLVAFAFWIMFGLMFGDVGHGLALAAAGWWIFRRIPRYRDYGVILMECGIASAAFGVAYGSVFGWEGLPALWFRPMDDVTRLLRAGVAFGLVFLGLAASFGVANAALRRDWRALVLGSHGLLAAIAYWSAAALALRWLATGRLGVSAGIAATLVTTPLAALWASGAWAAWQERTNPFAALLQSAVEVADLVVRSVANTVSFVRLAAFAASHAGLLLAVFALSETVSGSRWGTLSGLAVVVVGNVLIVAFEGLIVSIQAVRLVYYEFFSRFHEGVGLEYHPLKLRAHVREQGVA